MTGSGNACKVRIMRPHPVPDVPVAPWVHPRGLDPAERRGSPAGAGSQPVALVVDDEPGLGELMAMALGSQGWRTVVAAGPGEAAALASGHSIDLLVTDLQMPDMSGLDLARLLRERHADLPVVLMSGWREATALELAQPFVFLRKPFRLDKLFVAIGSLFADPLPSMPGQGASPGRATGALHDTKS